jgi:hypothetical protein
MNWRLSNFSELDLCKNQGLPPSKEELDVANVITTAQPIESDKNNVMNFQLH